MEPMQITTVPVNTATVHSLSVTQQGNVSSSGTKEAKQTKPSPNTKQFIPASTGKYLV